MRARHPHIGGLLLALGEAPAHERVWADGASGEEAVARSLAKRCDGDVVLLHDRRIPRSRANIDHLAVAPSGVWVIDAKRYKGEVEIRKPLFGERRLTIAGRDKTKLIHGLARQVELVRDAVTEVAPGIPAHDVPVHGALCFVEADLPLVRTLTFDGYPLLYPRGLAKRLNAGGPLAAEVVLTLGAKLAERFAVA